METFYSVAPRIIFALGVVNLLTGLAIFSSCRCIPGSKIGGRLLQYRWYKSFFKYHCHVWKVFWPSVMIHAALAIFLSV
jgi:hypothetical protein